MGFLTGDNIGVLRRDRLPAVWGVLQHKGQDGLPVTGLCAIRCGLALKCEAAMDHCMTRAKFTGADNAGFQSAFAEKRLERVIMRLGDCRPVAPPKTGDIHEICVIGKKCANAMAVTAVPGLGKGLGEIGRC